MTNKLIRSTLGSLVEIIFVLSFVMMVCAQAQEQVTPAPTPSTCKGEGCSAMSRAELFIKSFASSGDSKGLRTSELEQEERVKNAFYGIDATRVEIESRRLTKNEGEEIIYKHEEIIRRYVDSKNFFAMVKAAGGRVSDIPDITKNLTVLLSVARQDALMGREELAQEAQEKMVKVLTTFSQEFAETCEQQSFPVEVALGLERQNELMGTGISLMHCVNRKFSADLSSQGVNYRFETCSDLTILNAWKLKISGRVVGEGKGLVSGDDGHWDAETVYQGYKTGASGDMKITTVEIEEKEESVKIPNDAGPLAKPNGWAMAPIPKPPPRLKKVKFMKLSTNTILLEGARGYNGWGHGPWAEAEIKREDDKPCSP